MNKLKMAILGIIGAIVLFLGLDSWIGIYTNTSELSAIQASQLANMATTCFVFIALIILSGILDKLSSIHKVQQEQTLHTKKLVEFLYSIDITQNRNEQHLIELVKRTPAVQQFTRPSE